MAVAHFLLLSSLGLAITTQAQDCSRPVGGPNMSLKGDDILLQTFPDGTRVSFACDPGYVSAGGSASITCTAGTWSPVKLKCDPRNCGSFGELLNGQVTYPEGSSFGDQLLMICNEGYNLVGKPRVTCGVQGWEGRLAECEVVTCPAPPPVQNGNYSPIKEPYEYLEVVQYTCARDYTLIGTRTLSCSANGTFTPDPPTCTRVECPDPNIRNAEWYEGSRPPHGYQSTVTYRCRSGYTMIGSGILTCGVDSQWLPGLPTCIKTPTPTKPTTTTTTKDPAARTPITTASTTALSEPSSPDPVTPSNNGPRIGLGVGLAALIGCVITACVCYFCGVPACIKDKRSRGGYPDNDATKDGEDVALS
ncbi:membrane cofactor protein-like isoform X3 [Centropristis striata]|uniref:membrane cofactor protein-like isoform X3 n=1 Tax=Centropristis striata TaxID=184440 RepID=UPI0027E08588|nr:membrane cofactor protein-like isoform X3 [Centropristis striata]